MNKEHTTEIGLKTIFRFWGVFVTFALFLVIVYFARGVLVIIGLAFFLALILSLPVGKLSKLFPDRSRVLFTAIAYLVIVTVLGLVIFLVIPPILQQTAKFVKTIPDLVQNATIRNSYLGDLVERFNLQPQIDSTVKTIESSSYGIASSFGSSLWSGITSVLSVFLSILIILVMAFFMIIEGPTWMRKIYKLFDGHPKQLEVKRIAKRLYSVITSYALGQLTVAGIAALFCGLVVIILSFFFHEISYSLAIPTIAIVFVSSMIPMFGASVGLILIGIMLALNNWLAALIYVAICLVYQQVEGNFIVPKVQSKRLGLSALAILLSLAVGMYLFGFIGALISIPVAGCINVLVDEYLQGNLRLAKKPA